jgi:hypothetical protein
MQNDVMEGDLRGEMNEMEKWFARYGNRFQCLPTRGDKSELRSIPTRKSLLTDQWASLSLASHRYFRTSDKVLEAFIFEPRTMLHSRPAPNDQV